MTKFSRLFLFLLAGLLVGLVICAIVLRIAFSAFLNSKSFHDKIRIATARAIGAETVDLMPLHFAGTTIYCDGLEGRSSANALEHLRADQVRAEFNWHGLLHRAWQVDELSVERLDVKLGTKPATLQTAPEVPHARGSAQWRFDLKKAIVRDVRWSWNEPNGGLRGASMAFQPDGEAWVITAANGTFSQAGWPDMTLESARFRWQQPSLFIHDATLRKDEGRIEASGELNFTRELAMQFKVDGIDIAPLLTPDWRMRLSGKLAGQVDLHAPLGAQSPAGQAGAATVTGSLHLSNGQLTTLPVLDQIATFTRTQRFRQLTLTNAAADFTRTAGELSARNVVLESEGLLRMEGTFTVRDGEIDGTFQVGVTPASLQWLPGSQDRVFTVAHGGYLWTSLRLTGPVEHPREDLTARLAAAAGQKMIEDATGTMQDAAKGVMDILLH